MEVPQIQHVDKVLDVPLPPDPDRIVEAMMLTPQERVRQRTVEQAADVLVAMQRQTGKIVDAPVVSQRQAVTIQTEAQFISQ